MRGSCLFIFVVGVFWSFYYLFLFFLSSSPVSASLTFYVLVYDSSIGVYRMKGFLYKAAVLQTRDTANTAVLCKGICEESISPVSEGNNKMGNDTDEGEDAKHKPWWPC